MYTIGTVAKLANVTIRTLHHYDAIGLLRPSDRSASGYRLYSDEDVSRLQEILVYRALEVPLADVSRILSDPGYDRVGALREHRRLLVERRGELDHLLAAVEAALSAEEEGHPMNAEDKLAVFGSFDPDEHMGQAEARWGDTDAFKQSKARTSKYTRADWEQIQSDQAASLERFFQLYVAGAPADGADAREAAESHRLMIDRWFYDCPVEMHAALGAMYTESPQFAAHFEEKSVGLASFVRMAIEANALDRPD